MNKDSNNTESKKKLVSRRDFLVAGGAIIAAGALTACTPKTTTETVTNTLTQTNTKTLPATTVTGAAATTTITASVVTFNLIDPTGPTEITELFGKRITDLNGKTVGLLNAGWQGDRTLDLVAQLLKQKYPTINIISYTEFPGTRNDVDRPKIVELVQKFKCDAVIIGNAG
jgi:hypothetical protein